MKLGYAPAIVLAIVFTAVLMYGGCVGLATYIARCRSCERFNIDNIELRTQTDIKKTTDVWCRYDATTRTKTSVFYMAINCNELTNYIGINGFAKVGDAPPQFATMREWNDSLKHIAAVNLYYKKGSYKKDSWLLVFDSSRATLWAEIIEAPY